MDPIKDILEHLNITDQCTTIEAKKSFIFDNNTIE
jgi:ATP-dependent DNA helicase RecG